MKSYSTASMSDQAKVADTQPKEILLEKDRYYAWCSCGLSADGLFCDNAHRGTDFKSTKFSVEEPTKAFLCMCKATSTPPYCDGSHKNILTPKT